VLVVLVVAGLIIHENIHARVLEKANRFFCEAAVWKQNTLEFASKLLNLLRI
jgi:hypothetical protein